MSTNIEMDDLSRSRATSKATSAEPVENRDAGTESPAITNYSDASISVWAWTSAVVLALFSICLLAFPRLLLFLAEPSGGRGTLTALEKYFALHLGIILGVLAVATIAVLPNEWPTGLHRRTDPTCHPLLLPVTLATLLMALLSYNNSSVGTLTTPVVLGYGVVGLFGLWMLVFSGTSAISRKTGADKHTSTFIFGNKSAAGKKKLSWKRKGWSN